MKPRIVLILGSGPNVLECDSWPKLPDMVIVAINNAWRVRSDWNYLVCPEDFPEKNRPSPSECSQTQSVQGADQFVPANNRFGGILYCGATMAYTAGYWVLDRLEPDIMAYLGCDMVYPAANSRTHFYGTGTADPLRSDISLQDLAAKSNRLMIKAGERNCLCVNLSQSPDSRLTFPRLTYERLGQIDAAALSQLLETNRNNIRHEEVERAGQLERELGYYTESGKYWEEAENWDAGAIRKIDRHWNAAWDGE